MFKRVVVYACVILLKVPFFSPPPHFVFPHFTVNLLTVTLAPTRPACYTFLVVAEAPEALPGPDAEAMDLREAAYRLGVSERTLRQWIKDGKLAASMSVTEHARQWEIPESALLDQRTPQAGGQDAEGPGTVSEASGTVQDQPSGSPGGVAEGSVCESCLWLRHQIEAQNQQIHELHILLQQSQRSLPAPAPRRAWWARLWRL